MTHRYSLVLLGRFGVTRDGVSLETDSWPRRTRSLLSMLAVAGERRLARDTLIDRLWPNTGQEAGAANLRYVLHRLRSLLAAPPNHTGSPVLFERGWIWLNPAYCWDVDLDHLDDLLRGESLLDLEDTVAHYAGEPLTEDRYEDWVVPIREHVTRTWRELCRRQAVAHRAAGNADRAAGWLEYALHLDPLDEEVLQHLLQHLSDSGRRTDAYRVFQRFESQLRQEMGLEPEPETVALIDGLKSRGGAVPRQQAAQSHQVVPRYPLVASTPLIGRDEQLQDIMHRLATSSTPGFVLLAGEAGIGKTRMLAEIAIRARTLGAVTLAAGSYEQEGRLPYGPLHDALLDYFRAQPDGVVLSQFDGLLPDLSRVVPELRTRWPDLPQAWGGEGEHQRLVFFTALAQALERMCRQAPLVVLLDDLQWADDGTLQLLHFLPRQIEAGRLLIVGTHRPEDVPRDGALARLIDTWSRSSDLVPLGPLSETDLGALLHSRLGDPPASSLVGDVYRRTEGNPLFAVQLLQLVQQEDLLQREAGVWRLRDTRPLTLPPEIRLVVDRRLRRLDPVAREMLQRAAVLGREFVHAALQTLWSYPSDRLFSALDAARDLHLLVEIDGGYAFRHPLVREVVYSHIAARELETLHGRAALALEAMYGAEAGHYAAELAHHFRLGGTAYREQARHYLTQAGANAARVYANEEALGLYRRALELTDTRREVADLRVRMAPVLATMGRIDEALVMLELVCGVYEELAAHEPLLHAVGQIASLHLTRGTYEDGIARIENALRAPGPDSPALAALYGVQSSLLQADLQYDLGLVAAEQSVSVARSVGDDCLLAEAECRLALLLVAQDRVNEARPLLERALPLFETQHDLPNLARTVHALAELAAVEGHHDLYLEYLRREQVVAQRMGDPHATALAAISLARAEISAGRAESGRQALDDAVELSRRLKVTATLLSTLLARGRLHLLAGRGELGVRDLEEVAALASRMHAYRDQCSALRLLAQWDVTMNRPADAIQRLEGLEIGPELDPEAAHLWILAQAYLQLGYLPRARQLATAALDQAMLPGVPVSPISALRVYGMVATRQGKWRMAQRAFDEALEFALRSGDRYHEARIRYECGCMYQQQGDAERALSHLEPALEVFVGVDAAPYVELTRQALRSVSSTVASG